MKAKLMYVNNFVKIALIIQIVAVLSILFNIPVLRQLIGFIYFFFLPGLLLLRVLKLKTQTIVVTLMLAVGLSISFAMFLGFELNAVLPFVGILQPLSTTPVLVAMGAILLLATYLGRNSNRWNFSFPKLSRRMLFLALPLTLVLLTSVFGALLTSSWILLLMVSVIAILVIVAIGKRNIPAEFYPLAIFIIAISLGIQTELISSNIYGWDPFGEFYVFNLTLSHNLWNPAATISVPQLEDYNSMLSVTILPTLFYNLSGLSTVWIIKIAYFLVYAFVPLTMYEAYRKDFGRSIAFLSAFYFIFFPMFDVTPRREIIGELFLALIIFTILNRNIGSKAKSLVLFVFASTLVVSHYSVTYIFLFLAFFASIIVFVFQSKTTVLISKKTLSEKLGILSVPLVSSLAFSVAWYTFFSSSLNKTFSSFISHVVYSLSTGFSNPISKDSTVSDFVAPSLNTMSFVYKADYFINKIPYVLIIIGFIVLFLNRKKFKVQTEYSLMAFASFMILIMALSFPYFAQAFTADRFFHVALILLAPLCFYGGFKGLASVFRLFTNHNRARSLSISIICILFVAIFLFKTGFVNQVTGEIGPGTSESISYYGMKNSQDSLVLYSFYDPLVLNQDLYSVKWLAGMTSTNATIYADDTANKHMIIGYANRVVEYDNILFFNITFSSDSYVYLRTLNVNGYLVDAYGVLSNMTYVSAELINSSLIYSNGDSKIFFNP
jgi:uncharacterized membrane protein